MDVDGVLNSEAFMIKLDEQHRRLGEGGYPSTHSATAQKPLQERQHLMGWASTYIDLLKKGQALDFRPRGNSMSPKIKSGQQVTVVPVRPDTRITTGDVVLCRVHGREFLHFVKAIKNEGKQYVIGNAQGFINGTIPRGQIFGLLSKVGA